MKISIVIPAYKVEKYLRQCVDSVLQQTYRDLEIILVDDGSPDLCPRICDEYAAADERVTVIHKENGGLSDARNAGLRAAKGEYVLFVDGDDWLNSEDDLAALVERATLTKAEIISFSYKKVYDITGKERVYLRQKTPMPTELFRKKDQAEYLAERGFYIASAWNKMIRLSCLKRNSLFFKIGETSEDVVWCLRLLKSAESYDYLNRCIYCYRQRDGSITQTLTTANSILLANQIAECIRMIPDADELRKACRCYTAYQLATFMKVQTYAGAYPEEGVRILEPYAWLLRYHAGNRKLMVLRALTIVFRFSGACRILYNVYGVTNGHKTHTKSVDSFHPHI